MLDIKNATLVLLIDPNDGYDEIYAFEHANDANFLKQENINYYSGGYYDIVASQLARIITLEELEGRENLIPTHIFPAGCLNELHDEIDAANEDDDEEGATAAFDSWLESNRCYAVDASNFDSENDEDEED